MSATSLVAPTPERAEFLSKAQVVVWAPWLSPCRMGVDVARVRCTSTRQRSLLESECRQQATWVPCMPEPQIALLRFLSRSRFFLCTSC